MSDPMKPSRDAVLVVPPRLKRRRTRVGLALRATAICPIAVLAGFVLWNNVDARWWRERLSAGTARPNLSAPSGRRAVPPAKLPPATTASALAEIAASIVLLEADGPSGLRSVGSGFVVDPRGLVATSYHVAGEITAGVARFDDGRVYEIAGLAAVDPENDIAILQLRTGATTLAAVRLQTDGDPPQLSPIVAIGHPLGVAFSPFDGKVSRVVRSSQLSLPAQRFVRGLTGSERDHRWIQHTAQLSEGNSGGPLVNEQGRVIGVNTWVDRQTGFGYAMHAAALAALQQRRLPEIEPLERHTSTDARLRALVWQTSGANLRELLGRARQMNWSPASRAEYGQLQKLAWAITVANRPDLFSARSSLGDKLEELVREADKAVAELRGQKWNDIGQVTLLNEYAAAEVARPMAGLVFFGSIERIVHGKNGDRGALVRLAGFELMLFLPLAEQLMIPEPGEQCLIVGVNDRGRTVQYGDNPLQPTVAPIISAPLVVPLEK